MCRTNNTGPGLSEGRQDRIIHGHLILSRQGYFPLAEHNML